MGLTEKQIDEQFEAFLEYWAKNVKGQPVADCFMEWAESKQFATGDYFKLSALMFKEFLLKDDVF